jgi:hypothetical protein
MKLVARMRVFSLLSLTVLALLALALPAKTPVRSAPLQERARGIELVGHSSLGTGVLAGDIWVHGQYAYLGTSSCGKGVQVVDISNPTNPQLIGLLGSSSNSTYEDVVVIRANTPAFQGDLLAVGLQGCNLLGGARGVQFWDVTDPRRPRRLGFFNTGLIAPGVHELFLFQRDNRVFALLAVPYSELVGAGGDFRIVEVTDPRHPRQIADWGIQSDLGLSLLNDEFFCHSVWASSDGTVAYLSYWDAGVIMLDISDPGRPRFIGRTTYAPGEEGNAHSVWPANERNLLLVADEDFSTRGMSVQITDPAALAGLIAAAESRLTRSICAIGEMSGEVTYVGRGCTNDRYLSDPRGKIALIDYGGCDSRDKILRAQEAGALAVIVAHTISGPPFSLGGDPTGIAIAGGMISLQDGNRLKIALAGGETVRVRLTRDSSLSSWGFLRIYDLSDPTRPKQISTFATEHARKCPVPDGGWYTVHNLFVVGDTAFLSWYSDGLRVLDISDPANPRETAFFVPPDRSDGQGLRGGKALIWGVYVQGDLIFISDINTGLHILKRSGQ